LTDRQRFPGAAAWIVAPVALCGLAAGLLAWEAAGARAGARSGLAAVQTLVGGHGIGAVTVPAWCYFAFDPRAEAVCACRSWPLPGGHCFCPDHTATVTRFVEDPRELDRPRLRLAAAARDPARVRDRAHR
jgi:hypothetical protein